MMKLMKLVALFVVVMVAVLSQLSAAMPVFENLPPTSHTGSMPNEGLQQTIWEQSGRFEGDIVLSADDEKKARNGLIAKALHWPTKEVPYVISSMFTIEQADFINAAVKEYSKQTCITVRPAVSTDVNVVNITGYPDGCYALVGFQGGVQTLNLAPSELNTGCFVKGTILHEFLHALGFYHMQSAPDRDNYISIAWDNIIEDQQHNFVKYGTDTVTQYGVEYDYNSVMHYSAYAFSKNGMQTIIPLDGNAQIGQTVSFSERDIQKLELMYGCR